MNKHDYHCANCCGINKVCNCETPQQSTQPKLYTEEEVLEAIKTAFLDGFWTGIPGKTRYEINLKDYLPKR